MPGVGETKRTQPSVRLFQNDLLELFLPPALRRSVHRVAMVATGVER